MRSFISHFSAWFGALACILAIELSFAHRYHPSWADRSNFVSYGLEDNFVPDQMQQILYQKLRMDIDKPDFVQVGDSSGFFGIMPEVVEQYLPGMKYLNASCCATQGFNGYLALLRFNLRRFPSIKYMVVHSGIIAAYPGPIQWRGAPATLDVGVTLKTQGEKMETGLNPPWSLLDLPTNSLRQSVLQHTFFSEEVRDSVNTPKGPFEIIINGLQHRQGYGLEMDHQTTGDMGASAWACHTLKHESFFDWRTLSRKSYLDAFVEEYVALAREFKVVPIFVFQVTPCTDPGSADVMAMRENLKRLQQRFPELRVPFELFDPHPENDFSVLLHVERDVAQETSRRLGRALQRIVAAQEQTSPPIAAGGRLAIRRAARIDSCTQEETDITSVFGKACNGNAGCDIDLLAWKKTPSKAGCKAIYVAEFNCADGPTRIVRQEGEERFGGRFRLNCALHDRWPREAQPPGIMVADASFAGQGGNYMGLATLRLKAYCDGLAACNYAIKPPDRAPAAGDFTARWYCGAEEKSLHLKSARAGTTAKLACR